ncbi:MAG: nucleotide exchange factor GrpE [Proteobacteria bacterium]|nr:nucleotide exchange factor GrpE [Pseudomonadota bacterium]MDA1331689.1 nucleotide exchange factor GrpE [Pseudomonadota bacterium]
MSEKEIDKSIENQKIEEPVTDTKMNQEIAEAPIAPLPQDSEPSENILEQLQLAFAEAEKHKDAWLRATAELDNVRKRAQIDVAAAHKYALERFSTELLVVKDSLEAALENDNLTFGATYNGVELTLKQLTKVFESFGINEITPLGETLDPHKHQAMSAVDSDKATNTILSVFQKGYLLNDRLIRPALVSVAKSKE